MLKKISTRIKTIAGKQISLKNRIGIYWGNRGGGWDEHLKISFETKNLRNFSFENTRLELAQLI